MFLSDVDVADVDGDDLEGGLSVQPAGQHGLGDTVRAFQHDVVRFGRTDCADDAFTHASHDGLLGGSADQLAQVCADGHSGL